MDFTKSVKIMVLNCSNPCSVVDKVGHSRVRPVNIVKEEMTPGVSKENSLTVKG